MNRLRLRLPISRGITLVESVVGIVVFTLVAIAMYTSFTRMFDAVRANRVRLAAAAVVSEQAEIVRNLPYSSVGEQGGIPAGVIEPVKTLVRDGLSFVIDTTVRNVDDPFDGTIGGSPNDLSPADYKKVEFTVTCPSCRGFTSAGFTTVVAPKNLETTTNNGALFVQVLDANGQPVPEASVTIVNASATPQINLTDVTGTNGMLQLVDVPPGVNAYQISVTKSGHTAEQTYAIGAPGNPNPLKPHATVVVQQVTQISFSIDRVSTLDVASVTTNCAPIPSADFDLVGTRLIGQAPDVLKYDENHVTNGVGTLTLPTLEWDSYALTLNEASFNLAGTVPLAIFALTPNTELDFQIILAPRTDKAVMVSVKDAATQLPVSGAEVWLTGPGSYDTTLTTGRGFLRQTDWSGGSGQGTLVESDRYFSDDGFLDVVAPDGEIKLKDTFGSYAPAGELTSSTFDTGSASNFYNFSFLPLDQPAEAGMNPVRFQLATNDDQATWEFLGPDGTPWTYYTATSTNISSAHAGHRYLRYKASLSTETATSTPNVSDVAFTFTSTCVPPGQVLFDGLASGDYDVTVTKAGYQIYANTISVTPDWQQHDVLLSP